MHLNRWLFRISHLLASHALKRIAGLHKLKEDADGVVSVCKTPTSLVLSLLHHVLITPLPDPACCTAPSR